MLKRKKTSDELHASEEFLISENIQTPFQNKNDTSELKIDCWRPFLGTFYTFMTSLTILFSNVLVKKLTYIDTGQLSLVRNICVLIGNLPIAIYCTENIFGPKEYIWLLIARGIFGSTGLYLNLLSYRFLPFTESSIILSTLPALVTVAARLHLKEPCGSAQTVSIILIFLGVLVSIRLPEVLQTRSSTNFDSHYVFGLSCAVGCVLLLAFITISIRKLRNIHFSIVLIYFGFLGTIENTVITYFTAKFELPYCEGPDRMEVLLVGIFGFMGHCFLTLALQNETAGVVSSMKAAFDIVISIIFEFVFFNSIPDYYTLGSSLLVTIAIVTLGVWKWLQTGQENST
ncbi:solute carrier family 35 member G1 [Parasteatoda tepidariorum]|uniref:solute carrier family 35 member G1 n=1 Tax=Parasteatoda tepidariorum TaxID=114398 RepID=UPI001C720EB3|nr:solute carrier family 35 member G1 [Parasteatoda tepidariorum]